MPLDNGDTRDVMDDAVEGQPCYRCEDEGKEEDEGGKERRRNGTRQYYEEPEH